MNYEEKARTLFESGYNCAQASYGAFCEALGEDFDTAMKLAAPFGGGLGKMREVCGALSGMLMAYGLYSEGYEINNLEDKTAFYANVRTLCEAFKAEFGAITCRELLALPEGADNTPPEARTKEYYTRRPCSDFVAGAAKILAEEMQKGHTQP